MSLPCLLIIEILTIFMLSFCQMLQLVGAFKGSGAMDLWELCTFPLLIKLKMDSAHANCLHIRIFPFNGTRGSQDSHHPKNASPVLKAHQSASARFHFVNVLSC